MADLKSQCGCDEIGRLLCLRSRGSKERAGSSPVTRTKFKGEIMSKGSKQRPTDQDKYSEGWDRIFGKKSKKEKKEKKPKS